MLEQLKGFGRTVAWSHVGEHTVELLRYPDQSWGIRKDQFTLGVWENTEQEDCFRLFCRLIGMEHPIEETWTIVMRTRDSVPQTQIIAQPSMMN